MQEAQNRQFYERRSIGAHYASVSALQPGEEEVFRRHRATIAAGRILDLGVGGGRTTAFLLDMSRNYVGIDFSREMIARCRRRFPETRFEVRDAQDLSLFADESFDFILFSCTGIDSVGHSERLNIFSEVRRLLAPDGVFSFSSHNRRFTVPRPWDLRHFAVNPVREPWRFAKRIVSYPVGILNYLRLHSDFQSEEYCIRTDSAHLYSIIHYWIDAAAQKRQLESSGFGQVELFGADGRELGWADAQRSDDPWFHYVCKAKRLPQQGTRNAPAGERKSEFAQKAGRQSLLVG